MFDLNEYKNPSSIYRAKPFWSLNGDLKKEELKKQIFNMKKMGFGGAFLHSRAGLKTEYMGKEWLELLNYCVDILKENNMEAYLYDEDRWPSGTCGGYVTKIIEYRAKSMAYIELNEDAQVDNLLGIFALTLDSNYKTISYRKIYKYTDKKGDERVFAFFYQYMLPNSFYNGMTYVDTLNRDATDYFIKLTHEKYKEVMGDKFGKEIVGIFTDEPNRGPFFSGFSREEDNKEIEIPYTYTLFKEFYNRCGYKLEDHLPVLWFGKSSDKFVKETYDYMEVIQELFLENFAEPCFKWCKENKLVLTGHILHEDNLTAQTMMCGSAMRYFEYLSYPGVDNLGSNNNVYTVPALVSSVALQLGKDFILDELYGCSGWHMNLSDYKRMGDWQALLGITFRCPHLSWYTMEGEAKRDCPASIFHQSAFYTDYHIIEDYFSRLSYLYKNGIDKTDIAIINPIESTWGLSNQYSYLGPFEPKDKLLIKIEDEYKTLFKELKAYGVSLHYIDEGLFSKYGSVRDDHFICGKMEYKKIILNGNYNLRKTTLNALKLFISGGGKLYIVGSMPEYLDGIKHDFSDDLSKSTILPFNPSLLSEKLKDDLVVVDKRNIFVEKKYFSQDLFIFMLNQESKSLDTKIKIKTDKNVLLLDLRNGDIKPIKSKRDGSYLVIEKEFSPYEELALYCTLDYKAKEVDELKYDFYKEINEFNYELEEDNMLVLDHPRLYIDNSYIKEDYILDLDKYLRNKYNLEERHNSMVQPWFKGKMNLWDNEKKCHIALEYDFNVEYTPKAISYMFEYADSMKLYLNDNEVSLKNKNKSIIDNCFSVVELPVKHLKKSKNILRVEFDFYEKVNLESSFILGNFGVKLGDIDTITELNKTIIKGNLVEQGLPYYGGRIKVFKEIDNGTYFVKASDYNLALIKLMDKYIAFKPYEEIVEVLDNTLEGELVLNRNNSFGVSTLNKKRINIIDQGFNTIKLYRVNKGNKD